MSRPTAKEEAAEDTLLFSFSDELSEYLETTVPFCSVWYIRYHISVKKTKKNKQTGTGNSNEQTHKNVFVTITAHVCCSDTCASIVKSVES